MLRQNLESKLQLIQTLEPRFQMLFQNKMDYKDEPSLLDIAQNTANELALYIESKKMVKKLFKKKGEPLFVIDFCTGTGLFSEHILNMADIKKVVCVDTDDDFLEAARVRLIKHSGSDFEFLNEDAIQFKYGEPADLILMGSAYHHLEDEQKVEFLNNAKNLLKPEGYILVNENFLPPYSNSIESYRESVYLFYTALIKYLEKVGTSEDAINIIRQVAWYGYQYNYEYKVSYDVFKNHVKDAGLRVTKKLRVWPEKYPNTFPNENVGSFVAVLK